MPRYPAARYIITRFRPRTSGREQGKCGTFQALLIHHNSFTCHSSNHHHHLLYHYQLSHFHTATPKMAPQSIQPKNKLQEWFPNTKLPVIISAPMRGIVNGILAAQVTKAGGFGMSCHTLSSAFSLFFFSSFREEIWGHTFFFLILNYK